MSNPLLDGLGITSRLLLRYAVQHEYIPMHLAATAPLDEDEAADAIRALIERGLAQQHDRIPGLLQLSPAGYAVRDDVMGTWPALHAELRSRLNRHLRNAFELSPRSRLARALRAVDRSHFVPEPVRCVADLDMPVPTGVEGMTTSAPHAIVSILRAVDPRPRDRVLVCGAKGGVTLALAAEMVGAKGAAVALDWEADTVAHVCASVASYPDLASRTEVHHKPDVTVGHAAGGPWQAIVVNGNIPKIPWPLVDQLDPAGGRLLFFLQEPNQDGQSCYVIHKNREVVKDEHLSRFVFTPIYGRYGWDRMTDLQEAYDLAREE